MNVFRVGDRVKFLNEVGKGVVTAIINKEMVKVKNEDNWEMPVMIQDLIPDHEAQNQAREEDQPLHDNKVLPAIEEEPEDETIWKLADQSYLRKSKANIVLAMVPARDDQQKKLMDFYLINESELNIAFSAEVSSSGEVFPFYADVLEKDTKLLLNSVYFSDLRYLDSISIQILFLNQRPLKPLPSLHKKISLRKDFAGRNNLIDNEYFEEQAYIFNIKQDDDDKNLKLDAKKIREGMLSSKKKGPDSKEPKKPKNKQLVIDLHIESLRNDFLLINPDESYQVQMEAFHHKMNQAMASRFEEVVFIHGVGNGKLKNDIRREIENTYHLQYQDASFQEYGYGATMVFIPKK